MVAVDVDVEDLQNGPVISVDGNEIVLLVNYPAGGGGPIDL